MARKQFVSSRKNVSSGGLSSKEAALHGRTNLSNGTHPGESSDIEDGSIKEDGAVDSAMSSVPSSPISSEDGAVTDENTPMTAGDDADDLDASVQVVSAGVGRGKQLRFPTLISRGKESRVLFNGSDREGSDSESYASVASDEEEDNVDEDDPIDEETEEATTIQGTTSNHAQVESSPSVTTKQLDEDTVVCTYPIKAIRARKRHRPDSGYFRRMSTHVRDCLLSVRDTASAADVLREATHLEFRRKIENGKVERVEWREASPPRTSTSDTRTSTDVIEKEKPRKRDKPREEKRRDDTVSTDIKSKLQNEDSGERKKNESLAKTETNGQISCVQCQHASKTRDDSFIIPPPTVMMDVKILREKAAKLYEEARSLKHAGNDQGKSIPGSMGQIAQGKYYLRSSVKFFEQALVFADLKLAYRELKDDLHARQFGENCVKTLAQTSTLIESTIRTFQSAGSTKFVALGYKLAAIVHLTIYRFQHLKLFSLYSDLFTPGRSPDTRQSGTTPPVGGLDSSQELVKSHLLKEMEHTLRGFEMWRRYETCKFIVLPRITNPAVIHFNHLFEDFQAELDA